MKEEEILLGEAEQIVKILKTEGWGNVIKWVDKRIGICQAKVVSNENDISVSSIETKTDDKSKKISITIVNVEKDAFKNEIKVWKTFKKKVSDWETMVAEDRRK